MRSVLQRLLLAYLQPRPWEVRGRLYEAIGVRIFFRITPFEIRRALTGKRVRTIRSRADVPRYLRETVLAEWAHLLSFMMLVAFGIALWTAGAHWQALALCLVNLVCNLYPVCLMRYNRGRLVRALGSGSREALVGALRR